MQASSLELIAMLALLLIALRLGFVVHGRSAARQPIFGGPASALFNYLSAACFAAILPTVLMIVIVLQPEHVEVAGMIWHPLILAVLALAVGSFGFALLHAIVERGPLEGARQDEADREALGWTEADAKSSGL